MENENEKIQKLIKSLVTRVKDNGECTRAFEKDLTNFTKNLKDISILE